MSATTPARPPRTTRRLRSLALTPLLAAALLLGLGGSPVPGTAATGSPPGSASGSAPDSASAGTHEAKPVYTDPARLQGV